MFWFSVRSAVRLFVRWLGSLSTWTYETPIVFPTTGYEELRDSELIEEEGLDHFFHNDYYPARIGQVLGSHYQLVGKLGFGTTSTVWLARDLKWRRYVALKIYTRSERVGHEFRLYKYIHKANPHHDGRLFLRDALGFFAIPRLGGDHHCLVQEPMWSSVAELQMNYPDGCFDPAIVKSIVKQMIWALDYLHKECGLVHTDIKPDNILLDIVDDSIFEAFVQHELEVPTPRKRVNRRTIYSSKCFHPPNMLRSVKLCDMGSAVEGERYRNHNAQPDFFRAPEVMLKAPWSYPIDIWNIGVMAWLLIEGEPLFTGHHPGLDYYSSRAHLSEIVSLLGPPPKNLLRHGFRSKEFFDEKGNWIVKDIAPSERPNLEDSERSLRGEEKERFLNFMRKTIQWNPQSRATAADLWDDPWINSA